MRITIVGLGPGPAEWISPAAVACLRGPRVFARTRLHPALAALDVQYDSFDGVYEEAATLPEVHAAIVERLLSAPGDVVLAVPGDGTLGEGLLELLRDGGAEVR